MKIIGSYEWALIQSRLRYLEDYLERNENLRRREAAQAAADWGEIIRIQKKQKQDEYQEVYDALEAEQPTEQPTEQPKVDMTLNKEFDEFVRKEKENREK